MCLAIPSKVLALHGEEALVQCDGVKVKVSAAMVPELEVGDHVIVHAGFVLQRLSGEETREINEAIEEAAINHHDRA